MIGAQDGEFRSRGKHESDPNLSSAYVGIRYARAERFQAPVAVAKAAPGPAEQFVIHPILTCL
ncbi:MAG: hypothetical protein ACREBX_00685 [Sphingopyxis sp.]